MSNVRMIGCDLHEDRRDSNPQPSVPKIESWIAQSQTRARSSGNSSKTRCFQWC
jgi:hypothetical protein